MQYSRACEILRLTTPKSLVENARLAESMLKNMTSTSPLRYKVAAQVIMNAVK